MKKIIAILAFMLIAFTTNAQDIITKRDGNVIMSKVLEVSKTEVKFKKVDNLEGPTYTEPVSDLLSIRYEKSGKTEIFKEEVANTPKKIVSDLAVTPKQEEPANENLCDKGTQDARLHYTGQNCGSGWVSATSVLLSPLFGGLTAAIVNGEKPKIENLNAPQPSLLTNATYTGCYQAEAHKTKKKRVWTGFAIGSATWLLIFALL